MSITSNVLLAIGPVRRGREEGCSFSMADRSHSINPVPNERWCLLSSQRRHYCVSYRRGDGGLALIRTRARMAVTSRMPAPQAIAVA
jgi:hypothetical protein